MPTIKPVIPVWRDYLALCKPKVVLLMLVTAVVGMALATPNLVPARVLLFGTVGIALAASAAATINHLIDRRIDAIMGRTKGRPIPTGRIAPYRAVIFAVVLATLAMIVLVYWINMLTALLTLLSLIGYAGLYTVFLKRATPQNIVIGGAAGAAPPLLGWVAVTGHLDPNALLLVLIIYTWTPAHFWSLAIHRHADYARAEIPMLPVTHGVPFTKLCVLLYTLLLVGVSLLPYAVGMSGGWYLLGALLLDGGFIYHALRVNFSKRPLVAIHSFHYSNFYLLSLFVVLLLDHYI
jgi:heme o synthase